MTRKFHSKYLMQLASMVMLTASLFSVTACAQKDQDARPERGREHSRHRQPRDIESRVEMLTQKLQLTPEQIVQVKKIMETGQSKMQALRDKMEPGDRENMRATMMKIRTDEDNSIQKLLTIEQMEAWQAYLKEREKMMQQMAPEDGPRRGGPPGGMNPGGRF